MDRLTSLFAYFAVYSITAFLLNDKNCQNKVKFFCGLLIPILFAGCRFKVGTDYWQYMNNFERWAQMSFSAFFTTYKDLPLYRVIGWITYRIGGRVLTWSVFASLVAIPVFVVLKEDFEYLSHGTATMVFLLTAFTSSFNLSKQCIAVSIVFWAMKYVFENKVFKFLLCIFIAAMFHETALCGVIIWFLWDHKNNEAIIGRRRFLYIIAGGIFVYFYRQLLLLISQNFSMFEEFSTYATTKATRNRDFFVIILELVIILLFYRRLILIDKRNNIYVTLLILTLLIGVTGFSHPQVKRIAYYYSVPAECILFGYLPRCFESKSALIIKMLIILYFCSVFALTYYILGQSHILPYYFDITTSWS